MEPRGFDLGTGWGKALNKELKSLILFVCVKLDLSPSLKSGWNLGLLIFSLIGVVLMVVPMVVFGAAFRGVLG